MGGQSTKDTGERNAEYYVTATGRIIEVILP